MLKALVLGCLVVCTFADIDPGQIGLEFFGNEFAFTQKIPNFPTTEFSLTFRIKASSGNIMNYGVPVGKQFDGAHLSLKAANALQISRGSTVWQSGANFADRQWHAIAITWKMSTGEMILYKDGARVGSTQISKGTPMAVDGYLMIGQVQNCPVGCFEKGTGFVGTLADMSLWKRALSANQVTYLSINSPSGDESDLVSYWPLNENDGIVGKDRTPRANDFSLGGPSFSPDVGLTGTSSALAFHKNSAVLLKPVNDLPVGDFSVEFWIKTAVREDSMILSYYNPSDTNNPRPLRIHNPGLLTVDLNKEQARTDTSVATGSWNHVTLTWTRTAGRLRMYLNGALTFPPAWLPESDYDMMPTLALGSSLPARPTLVVVGNEVDCVTGSCLITGSGLDGVVQDLRIWSSVRSAAQVSQWRNAMLPTNPVPDTIALDWVLNDKVGTSKAADTSGRGNDGMLTVPLWKNTLIAPPFPTLDEVNQKVSVLRDQLADLMDFVKDVMEPQETTANQTFTVAAESKCGRRYKYLCTLKTETAAKNAPAPAPAAATKPSLNVNVLVQRALNHNDMKFSDLTESLTPKHVDTSKHSALIAQLTGTGAEKTDELLQIGESDQLDDSVAITTAPVKSVPAAPAVVQSKPSDDFRVRHAWTSPQAMPAKAHEDAVPVQGMRSIVSGGQAVGVSHSHARLAGPRVRHAWSSGKVENVDRPLASASETEFLQEEQRVVAASDVDDEGPESLVRSKSAKRVVEEKDFETIQKEFEQQEKTIQNLGQSHDAAPWLEDVPTKQAQVVVAMQEDEGSAPQEQPQDESTHDAAQSPPHHHHHTHQQHQQHHQHHQHHEHHEQHHHHALVQAAQSSKVEPTAHTTQPVVAPKQVAKQVASPRQVKQVAAPQVKIQTQVDVAKSKSTEDIGTKFEQLEMPGAENEWDQAIAEGVGNSDLADDDVHEDDFQVQ